MRKAYLAVFVILLAALVMVVLNYSVFTSPGKAFFNGVRIYDAIKSYNYLASNGFDISVSVAGRDYKGPVRLEGAVVEVHYGWFILDAGKGYRIVEGPMGSQDVMADYITFSVSPALTVEAVYPPAELDMGGLILRGFDKFKGSISLDTEGMPGAGLVQRIRNSDKEVYLSLEKNMEVETYNKGIIIDIGMPIKMGTLEEMISLINDEAKINKISTGYRFYYAGAENEDAADRIMAGLEDALMVRRYEP